MIFLIHVLVKWRSTKLVKYELLRISNGQEFVRLSSSKITECESNMQSYNTKYQCFQHQIQCNYWNSWVQFGSSSLNVVDFESPPQKNLPHAQVCAFCDSANCRFRHLSLMDRKTFYALLLIQLHISLFFFCWSCLHNSISHLENHEICNQNTHYSELMLNDLNEIEQPNQVGIMNKKVPNTIGASKVI